MNAYLETVKLWQSYDIISEADIDLRLHNFRILFAYNSGRIENERITLHDTREIFENGQVLNFSGNPRTLFELGNQKLCYEYLKPLIAGKKALSIPLILEIHGILTGGTYDERRFVERGERPGRFKKHDYVTGREEVGSTPEDVEGDLQELLDELSDLSAENILKAAAYFHARFEYIHPFADGNGRVGRTLLNYFLMINNHPPLIVYDEDKSEYYAALESYDRDESIDALYAFLQKQVCKTWQKTMGRNRVCEKKT